jgi:membrane fusion protein (multidrug efflux system)
VEQAEGTLREAEADLSFAKQQVSLLEAEANLESAKANLLKAQQDYDRLKPLVEQDAAARQDLDASTAALRAAESNVRAKEATARQARLTTDTQIQSTQGRLQQQRGTLEAAKLNVQYGTIRSPISGMIGDTMVPVGGLVSTNSPQPLTTVVPLNPIWVRFKLSESQYMEYQRLQAGSKGQGPPLELFLADSTKFPETGRIENALNQVDPRTGTLEVQARFPNPQNALLPGQFGRVRFQVRERQAAILIPQRAVQQNQNIQTVYAVAAENKIEARAVTLGERVGDDWIVEKGLRPGDRVVVEGILSIRPGVVVRPVPYQKADAGQDAAGKSE